MPRASRFAALAGAALLCAAAATAAALLQVDPDRSTISARFKQMGVPVSAEFGEFSGELRFDPTAPAESSARIVVQTASFDIGDEDYNAEVRKPEWLDTGTHPQASFVAHSVEPDGDGRFVARGEFTLKGRSEMRDIAFSTERAAEARVFTGELSLSRKAYEIGDEDWDSVLEDEVLVEFRIVAD